MILIFFYLIQIIICIYTIYLLETIVLRVLPSLSVFTLPYRGMVKYCNRAWKKWFFACFFRNISKTAEIILIKKIGRNHGISVYRKSLVSEHHKNYIFRDINYFFKMSVSKLVYTLPIFVDELAQKLVWISKPNITHGFDALRLRAD